MDQAEFEVCLNRLGLVPEGAPGVRREPKLDVTFDVSDVSCTSYEALLDQTREKLWELRGHPADRGWFERL